MNNLADIKDRHNIVDIIGQYVTLRKQGKEFAACCPFHDEKTPSFTVNEQKQFYHCFGCGAHGDVIKFVEQYEGLTFVESCKKLGAVSEYMPSKQIRANLKRAKTLPKFSLPCDDRRNSDFCMELINSCNFIDAKPVSYYESVDGDKWVSVVDWFGEVVNMFDGFEFIAGGLSYGAFTPIRIKNNDNFMLCVDTKDAIDISNKYKVNVLICYSDHNLKYVYKNNTTKAHMLPVIREKDDDYLCYECEWLSYKNNELKKEAIKNV